MVKDRISRDDAESFILDGYPRTVDQVETLDAMLAELGRPLDVVLALVVDPEELIGRLLKRAETSGRADDTEEVIRHRQEVYSAETAPLLEDLRRARPAPRGRRHGRRRRDRPAHRQCT